ncbi:MAG: molybdenum cofactor guanylyltransferase, partial [Planctomycetota bacterium]|nr:molybdenum cofactor guanylyltransferase [Planctomycetota bacterium]
MTTHGIIAPPLRRDDLLGAVLTGGASRRMGSPKCDLVVSGVRVLERLCGLLSARTGGVILAGGRPDPAGLSRDWPCVPDAFPGLGPLGGIATALRHAPGVGVLVVACDMVALGGEVLDHLLAGRNPQAAATVL